MVPTPGGGFDGTRPVRHRGHSASARSTVRAVTEELYSLLACPHDRTAPLRQESGALVCPRCNARFPISDGVVSFLGAQELSEAEQRERSSRDDQSGWYDTMFEGYTNAVEVPTVVRRVGRPDGPILDHGAGSGRISEALLDLGQPVVALDYSGAMLRLAVERAKGRPLLAVQSDGRRLPLRDGVFHAATCIEVYVHFREDDRRRILDELARVLVPSGRLVISALNWNLVYRVWEKLGNEGAREGEHLLGDMYYRRLSKQEFCDEVERLFDVEEMVGIRNIPARTLAGGIRKAGLSRAADRFLDVMVERGHRLDWALEKTPLSGLTGFFWLATARRRA